jgi:hypothetical protein
MSTKWNWHITKWMTDHSRLSLQKTKHFCKVNLAENQIPKIIYSKIMYDNYQEPITYTYC